MIYLKKDELKDAYFEAERTAVDWMKPFNEYERIAGNKLSKTLGKNMPRVNDGSLAASLIETPMNVLPEMQSGKFKSQGRKKAWLNEIANIIWQTALVNWHTCCWVYLWYTVHFFWCYLYKNFVRISCTRGVDYFLECFT